MDAPIRVLIADDHGLLRAGLRALLDADPDLQPVGEATTGQETLQLAGELHPDVVLLDISMPGMGGIEATRQLVETLPETRVLVLTAHEDEALLRGAMQAGAVGYLVKRAVERELVDAIHAVWRGDLYVHPAMTRALLRDVMPAAAGGASASVAEGYRESLTPRETDVLRLIARGHTNRQSAGVLGISVRTVETHRANIMDKLGLRGRMELVRYAMEHGLLDQE